MLLKKNFIFVSISLTLSSFLFNSNVKAAWYVTGNKATPDNLQLFTLPSPQLTEQQKLDMEKANEAEMHESLDFEKYKNHLIKKFKFTETMVYDFVEHTLRQLPLTDFDFDFLIKSSLSNDKVDVEIYQNSKVIGKQFLVVRHNNKIRYVFATSTGKEGHSTPELINPKVVFKQRWRHMSTLYPGQSENNMDHASYFYGPIAFHSATFGAYSKLGKKDSHGCVRMAMPQARRVYTLLQEVGINNVNVYSYKNADPNPSELDIIKMQLALDFNFIKDKLLAKSEKGDIPFNKFSEYMEYKQGHIDSQTLNRKMKDKNIKEIIEIDPEMDLGPGEPLPPEPLNT